MKNFLPCPYDSCGSNNVTVIDYRFCPQTITYECYCRDCERRFASSIRLDI